MRLQDTRGTVQSKTVRPGRSDECEQGGLFEWMPDRRELQSRYVSPGHSVRQAWLRGRVGDGHQRGVLPENMSVFHGSRL